MIWCRCGCGCLAWWLFIVLLRCQSPGICIYSHSNSRGCLKQSGVWRFEEGGSDISVKPSAWPDKRVRFGSFLWVCPVSPPLQRELFNVCASDLFTWIKIVCLDFVNIWEVTHIVPIQKEKQNDNFLLKCEYQLQLQHRKSGQSLLMPYVMSSKACAPGSLFWEN